MQPSGLQLLDVNTKLNVQGDLNYAAEFQTLRVKKRLRKLNGKNRASLVLASNGRYYVEKFANYDDSDRCFNEAFGTQLARSLGLPFPRWAGLDVGRSTDETSRSSFAYGSELIDIEVLEYLPGGWYPAVANREIAFTCLLFDLWSNHSDARQAIFQQRASRHFRAFFVDNDQLFSKEENLSLKQRIARARYWDIRLYAGFTHAIGTSLQLFADKIRTLMRNDIHEHAKRIPSHWGSFAYRHQVLCGLQKRVQDLDAYIAEIERFALSIERMG